MRIGSPGRASVAGIVSVLALGGAVVFGVDSGHTAHNVRLLSGAAWLSSAKVGQLTLLDGTSAEVSAQVQVAPAGNALTVVQQGSTAYAVDQTTGTVRRVDGGTFELTQPESPISDANAGLAVLPGRDSLYTMDGRRGVLVETDPRTLRRRGETVSLATRLSAGTAVVDDNGTLWAIDTATGDLVHVSGGKRASKPKVIQPGGGVLTLAGGAPVVVDTASRKATTFDPATGRVRANLELDLRPSDTVHVSGSPHGSKLYVVASRGTLFICQLTASSCESAIPLNAGSQLGAPVEAANRLFVPDHTTGEVWIIDLTQARVVAKATVLAPAGKFQLLTRDGVVFYNDPDSARAGVIHLDGTVRAATKYDANDPGKGVNKPVDNPAQPHKPDPSNPRPTDPSNPKPNDPNSPKPNDPRQQPKPNNPQPNPTDPQQPDPNNPQQPDPNNPQQPDPQQPDPDPPQRPTLEIVMTKASPTVNEPVTLKVNNTTGSQPDNATWNFGDGTGAEGVTVPHQWTAPSTPPHYPVSVNATWSDGRSAATSVNVVVTAKPTYTLAVNLPGGGGTVKGDRIDCPGTCSADYDRDLKPTIRLTATPDDDHELGTWTGACSGAAAACDVTVDASKTAGYEFKARDRTVTYTIAPPRNGKITINGVTCPQTCTYTTTRNTPVSLTATADTDYDFDKWSGGCPQAGASQCSFRAGNSMEIAATFKLIQFSITVQIEGGGKVASDKFPTCSPPQGCAHYLDMGTKVTLTAMPDPGHQFLGWSGGWCGSTDLRCVIEANFENKFAIARFS